jgi:hypothetical protein
MPALALAALTFVAALASGLAGLALSRTLPQAELDDRSRLLLAGVASLAGLLLVATLGGSIWSASAVTQRETAALRGLAADALAFDLAARRLGPPAAEARRKLGAELAVTGSGLRAGAGPAAAGAVAADIAAMAAALDELKPADEAGRRALAEADRLYGAIAEARLAMALPPGDPISWPVVLAALAWSCLLFFGLGALSRANAATVGALALGGATAASAIWLGIALSQPLTGPFRLSPAPIEQVLMEIAQ